jgi:hypothetical protein
MWKEMKENPGTFLLLVLNSVLFTSCMAWMSNESIESDRRWKEYQVAVMKWRHDCIMGGNKLVSYPYRVREKYKKNKYHYVTKYTTRCEKPA